MKVLVVGESWFIHSIHVKGFDTFTTSKYEEGGKWLLEALKGGGMDVEYMPSHVAMDHFPYTVEELKQYDAIVLSDVGANTFLLPLATFEKSEVRPNRLEVMRQYVEEGGGLVMVGGYMSFSGIDGKARYGGTPVAEALPVNCLTEDDRVEHPEGVVPQVQLADHAVLAGVPAEWPHFLGYNRMQAKEGSEVIITVDDDPFVVAGTYGQGRSVAFASDCAPHWGPPEFLSWAGYNKFWVNAVRWAAGK